jgi:GT2 family glycosyltransferase
MRAHLKASSGTVVTGRVEAAGDEEVPIVVTSMSPATYSRPRLKFDTLVGGNMGVARAVINQVGLLDEDAVLRCSEDGEWAYRALRAGVQIKYAPDIVIFHYGWRDSRERQQQYREYAKSSGGFYGKYIRQGDWFIGLRAIVHYLRELRRLVRAAVTRNAEELRMSWACLRWLVPGIFAGFRSENARVGPSVNSDQ